jgi:hypothetical protein
MTTVKTQKVNQTLRMAYTSGRKSIKDVSSSGSGCFDPAEQGGRVRHVAFGFIAKHGFAIYEHRQVSRLAGLDFWLDTKLLLGCLLQAHGCTADVQSKKATADFDVHESHYKGN